MIDEEYERAGLAKLGVSPSKLGVSPSKLSPIGDGEKSSEELRCVICVFRHGDRTPKQKLKFKKLSRLPKKEHPSAAETLRCSILTGR